MRVLLVVDMQKGFMINNKYLKLNKKIEQFIAKNNYDKMIFTKYINDASKNPLYQKRLGWHKLKSKEECDFSINVPLNAIVIEKYGYGLGIDDLNYIKSLNVNEIDICGIEEDACIYAISLQLWDNGIFPNILSNYVSGSVSMKKIFEKQFGRTSN